MLLPASSGDLLGGVQPAISSGQDAPCLNALDTQFEPPSAANLDRELLGVQPTFWYNGEDYTGTTLPAEVGGAAGLLTETGAGSLSAAGSPLMGSDAAIQGDGTNYLQAGGNSFADITTEHIVIEMVVKITSANKRVFGKLGGTGFYAIANGTATGVNFYIADSSGTVGIASPSITAGTWNHLLIVMHRSGSGIVYRNGEAGSAVNISARQLTLGNAGVLQVHAANSAAQFDGDLALLAMWEPTLTTHDHADLAAQRFRTLTGFRPQSSAAGVDTAPVTFARNSNATLEKYNESTGEVELYTVGPHWMRVERWLDDSANVVMGYRAELAGTNKRTQSVDIDNWTQLRCSVAASGSVTTPWGDAAWAIREDTATGTHPAYLGQAVTTAQHVLSAYVRAGTRDYFSFLFTASGSDPEATYTLTGAGSVGYTANIDSATINRLGTSAWYRVEMVWTPAAAETKNIQLRPCEDATATGDSYTGVAGDPESIYVHGVQCEVGSVASSFVATAGSGVTRVKDEEIDAGGANVGGSGSEKQGAVVFDVLTRAATPATASSLVNINDGGSASDMIDVILKTDGTIDVDVRASGGTAGDVTSTATVNDGSVHRVGVAWKEGLLELWINGSLEASDTSVDIPDDLDRIANAEDEAGALQPSIPTLLRRRRHYSRFQSNMASLTSGVS